jgi:hypothetical protein
MSGEIESLDDAALRAMDAEAIADAFVATRRAVHFAHRVAHVHSAMREPAGRRAIIARLIASNRIAARPEQILLPTLLRAATDDPETIELALEVAEGVDEVASAALDVLLAQRHPATLARLDGELEKAIEMRPPPWTNGHATLWLATSIRAAFLLAGDRAYDRFAVHFTHEALTTEAGLQVAASILLVGTGYIARHQVTVESGEGPVITADPRFFSLAASLLGHPKLKRLATDVLKLLPARERKAVTTAHAPGTFDPVAKPKKKPAYRAGDRVRMFRSVHDWRGTPVTLAKVHPSGDVEIERDDGLRSAIYGASSFAPLAAVD